MAWHDSSYAAQIRLMNEILKGWDTAKQVYGFKYWGAEQFAPQPFHIDLNELSGVLAVPSQEDPKAVSAAMKEIRARI